MKLRAFQESDWPRLAMLATSAEVNKTYMLPDFESVEKVRPRRGGTGRGGPEAA